MPSPYYPFMPKKQKKKRKKKDAWSQVKELCLPVPRNSVRPQSSQIAYMLLLRPNRLVLISRSSRWPTTTTIKKITKWWRRRTRTATIEAHFIIYATRIAKLKITENDRKHIVNLNESFLQIIWDYPWTQDGILLVSHLLNLYFHGKSFLCNSAPIFLKEA